MACKQIFAARIEPMHTSLSRYIGPSLAKYEWNPTLVGAPWRVDGAFKNASIELLLAPGTGKSFTFTLVKNGTDTALTITIAGAATTGQDITSTVNVVAGDLLYWRCTPGATLSTTSQQRFSVEFDATNDYESGYASLEGINTTQTWRGSVFSAGQWNTSNIGIGAMEVVGAAGNLTELYYNLAVAPGSTDSYEFALYINGTKQDGAGATTDTRVTITGSATTGSWTGSIALTPGDWVILQSIPTGGPVSTTVGYASKFVATTDGESQFCAVTFFNLPTSGGPYFSAPHWNSLTWSATETDVDVRSSAVSACVLRDMRVRLSSTVVIGPITFTVRLNGAGAGPSITLAATSQTGSDLTNSASVSAADMITLGYSLAASPGGARFASIGLVMYALATPAVIIISNTTVFGLNTTANISNAFAVGLDGNTNLLDEEGKLKVFGNLAATEYVALHPMSAPTAPAGEAALYIDTADGDLKIKFANATVKVIETN